MRQVKGNQQITAMYDRINSIHMGQVERQVAVNAMQTADILVDGLIWILEKIEKVSERLFLRPELKH